MKDEIKEIVVDNGELIAYYKDGSFQAFDTLLQEVLDYITNLQGKVNQYENPDDLTLFYMWLDVKAKDKMKELEDNLYSANQVVNELLDVKEENKRLKELCDKYEEEHKTAFKLWTMKMEEMPNYEEFVDYKSRNEKAVEYIKNTIFWGIYEDTPMCEVKYGDELLNILTGGDKE